MAEDVERGVHPRLDSRLAHAPREPAPPGQVVLRPGEPIDAAVRTAANGRQGSQVGEQSFAVDVAHSGTSSGSKGRHFTKRPTSRRPTIAPSR